MKMTKVRKEIIDLLIKLDKAGTENEWEYQSSCEYRNMKSAKRCAKIETIIRKKEESLWNKLMRSFKVESRRDLPKEIIDYYNECRENNRYDRFNNYEKDLINLGLKLPQR